VHAPVAHYAEELGGRVDRFFDRLAPGKPVRRRNLSLWPACLLWVPTSRIDGELWDPPSNDPAVPGLWLRSERQTLRRLPRSGAILFTIRVQMAALAALADRPDRAGDLAMWLRSPGGESRRRELGPRLEHDLHWLDAVAGTAA
jgi:dimethylamine monooxygenase subunit A